MTESLELPPIQFRKEAADRLAAILLKRSEVALREDAARFEAEKGGPYVAADETGKSEQLLADYASTGDVRHLQVQASVGNITHENRHRSMGGHNDYEANTFEVLDQPYDSCTVKLSGWEIRDAIRVDITPSSCSLTLESDGYTMNSTQQEPLSIDDLAAILLEYKVDLPAPEARASRVALGHGGGDQWRVLRDELRDHHDVDIEAFETHPRAGYTIADVLEQIASTASVALLVLTAADAMADGTWRGRQNVVHEIGFFQGRLGWENAITVVEDGVDLPSNLDGTQQVRFPKGNIRAATGEVLAVLRQRRA